VSQPLVIDHRYNGLTGRALGGYVGRAMAAATPTVDRGMQVTLRRPAPLGVALDLELGPQGQVLLRSADETLAEGDPRTAELAVPDPITLEAATDASRSYWGFGPHGFPAQLRCFCCGPERPVGEGLRIFPGPLGTGGMVAARWTPQPSHANPAGLVPAPITWSALDCPALWALIVSAPTDSPEQVVSGRFATEMVGQVRSDQPHVVLAWPIGADGRKRFAGAALFSPDGELLARSMQTCLVVDGGVPLGERRWRSPVG
jgi:hypothetical protein